MKTGTLVNRLILILIGFSFPVFFTAAAGQTLTVNDIPDQAINPGESFSEINLDNYIDVPANELHNIQWSASGADQLDVNIDNGRKAKIIPLSDSWRGSETITFHAMDTDMNTGSDAATFTVQQAANAAPVVGDIPGQTLPEGSSFQPVNLDDYVTDADDPISQITWSAEGNSALSVDINTGSHTATIGVPNTDWNGSETIIFKATDPASGSSQDEATFTLTPVNDPPVISNIPDQSINSGESFSPVALDDYVTDVDNSKSELSWTITGNTSLTPSVNGSHIATINQPANWSGSEKLTFTVKDPANESASDDAVFEAKAVNANPVAADDNYSTQQGATLNIAAPGVLSNDTDADLDPLTAIKVSNPSHGTVTLNLDGSFTYINDGSASTSDAFTYKASDGTNESTAATVTLNITLNVAPVLSGIEGATLTFTEGDMPVSVTSSITVTDGDDTNLASAQITISSNYQNSEDMLTFANTGNISGSWNPANGRLSLTGNATIADYQSALRAVKYTNGSSNPNTSTRTVSFRVSDQFNNSSTVSRTISVTATNVPPVLAGIEGSALSYSKGAGSVNVTSTLTATDADNTNLASAQITISSNYQNAEDVLSFTNANGINGSWNAAGGVLTLTGSASVANYQAALRAVKYTNNSANPSSLTRTITFRVNDGIDNSNNQARNINVAGNAPPVLSSIEGTTVAYAEGAGPVAVTSFLNVTDTDDPNIASAIVSISVNYQNGEDVLSFTAASGITGSFNTGTGQLLLTGSATLASYRTALRSVRYTNNSTNPSNLTRTVSFRVNDGTDNSNTAIRNISVSPLNDVPVLDNIETSTLAYTEGSAPVVITTALTVSDPDNPSLSSATITITGNYQNGEDVLSFTNTGEITGIWNAGSARLTLSGIATLANYQSALRAVRYVNSSSNPNTATRAITFRVNDGTDNSNTQARNVSVTAVNDPPVLAGIETTVLAYTEGDGPVSVSGAVTVSDVDNLTLPSALISISANYKNTQDVLSFANANGITSLWNATAGQLTLTGNVTPAIMQSALRSVKYRNTSVNPNTDVRTVTFRVSDGTVNSNVVSRNISITRVGEFTGSISGSASYCPGSVMPVVLTFSDGMQPFTATLTRSGSVHNQDTVITGITASPYSINVKLTGSYVLSKLTDSQGDEATLSTSPVVLSTFTRPKGVLSGPSTTCNDGQPVQLSLNLTGTSPWTFTIRRGSAASDTIYTGITADPYNFPVRITSSPMAIRLISISDANCAGDTIGSGTVRVTYLPSPVASIQTIPGQDTICPDKTANLKVTITGSIGPWSITYLRDGANPTVIPSIATSPYTLVVPGPGTYTLSKVQQLSGGCTGKVSGTAKIVSFTVPTASISGSATFCEHASGNLNVQLTGNSPWKFSYKLNSGPPVEVLNVASSPKSVPINKAGTYSLVEVYDKNCKGTASGSTHVTIIPAPQVSISGLAPAYNKDSTRMIPLSGDPLGGIFSGLGVITLGTDYYFITSFPPVGTHNVVYSYQDGTTHCYGYDTAVVRILKANAIVEFPGDRMKYCNNDDPFTITGATLALTTGSFKISGGVGLVDHGDNTATVNPSLLGSPDLSSKEYTITYTYFDGTTLTVNSIFEVGNPPVVDFKWETDCFEPGQPVELRDASSPSNFGNITSYNWKIFTSTGYDTSTTRNFNYTFPGANNYDVELQVATSNGCLGTVSKVFGLRPTITLKEQAINESFEESPISWQSATLTPNSNSWTLDTPPANSLINRAATGTKCWFTNLPGINPPREKSWVSSPCYNFTGMKRPMVKMQIWRDFNGLRDGVNLQATTDSAKSWFNIGQMDDGKNWYTEYLILGRPGDQATGWSNIQDGGWKEARHSLDMLKGQKSVQFRIAYGSDGTVHNTEGFAFDDFWIGERNRTVLVEHFTNAPDEASQAADAKLNALVDADSLNTFDLQYHTYFPGVDPFYEQEPYAPRARLLYYGIVDVPYGILNGGYKPGYRFDYKPANDKDTTLIHLESLNDAAFDLKFLSSGFTDSQVNFELQIDANSVLPAHEYTVYAGIYERKVAGTGSFIGTVYQNVVRAFLPDPAGITIAGPWPAGGQKNYSYQWDIPADINRDQLMAFAFMQDEETHEVYQVNKVKIGYASETGINLPGSSRDKFIVFPNPARDQVFIRFEKPVRGDVRIEMFNNLGSLVYTEIISQTDNDIGLLTDKYPNGLYILRITSGNELIGVTKLNITQ